MATAPTNISTATPCAQLLPFLARPVVSVQMGSSVLRTARQPTSALTTTALLCFPTNINAPLLPSASQATASSTLTIQTPLIPQTPRTLLALQAIIITRITLTLPTTQTAATTPTSL